MMSRLYDQWLGVPDQVNEEEKVVTVQTYWLENCVIINKIEVIFAYTHQGLYITDIFTKNTDSKMFQLFTDIEDIFKKQVCFGELQWSMFII